MAKNPILEVVRIIKENHLSSDAMDRHFNIFMKNRAILTIGPKPSSAKQLEEVKIAQTDARNALFVLYSLLKAKPKDREKVISAIRKIQEIDPYQDLPGELEINPAHVDSAVLYSVEDILFPKQPKSPALKKKAA